jgi:glycosyltransferase 2 family protein
MKRLWLRVAQVVLIALVGWGIYRVVAPELAKLRVEDLLRYRPSVLLLTISTALLVSAYLMHSWLWRHIAVALSDARLSIRPAMRIYFVSGLGRYIPGKLWQMAGMAALAHRAGFSAVAATAASLVGQLAFMTTGVVFLALLLPSMLRGAAGLVGALLLALAVVVFVIAATDRGKALRHRLLQRLDPRLAQAGALFDRMKVRTALGWWALYGVSWVLIGSAFALFVVAFVPTELGHMRAFAGIGVVSYVLGYISFTPAGIGVREGVMLTLLTATFPASAAPAALLISIVSRLWFTAGELLPLAVIPVLPEGSEVLERGEGA